MKRLWTGLSLLTLPLASQGPAAAVDTVYAADPIGVVVEGAESGFAAHRAGFQTGDILLRWERAASPPANPQPAGGPIESPFDLLVVEMEQAPRGDLTISGTRGGERLRRQLPRERWKLRTRPLLTGPELTTYEKASALLAKDAIGRGLSLWERMASDLAKGGDSLEACWLFLEIARVANANRDWETAKRAFDKAQDQARENGEAEVLAIIKDSEAKSFQDRNEFERASMAFHEALKIRQGISSESLGFAKNLLSLGSIAWFRGDFAVAEDYSRRSLALREKLAPQSSPVARSLNNLGNVAWIRGHLAVAESYHRRSLALREKLVPQSLDVSASLNALGVVAKDRSDLAEAEDFFRRSLAIREKLAPQTPDVAMCLNNLGVVAFDRADFAAAEDYYRRSLAIWKKHHSSKRQVAMSLNNLGNVALSRDDLVAAEDYHHRALAIKKELAPQSIEVAKSFNNLGTIALQRKNLEKAEDYLRRALALYERHGSKSVGTAESLRLLGDVALARSDPNSAETLYERALAIRRERAPGSALEAESCQRLAALHRHRGQISQALVFYDCAIEALEAQKGRLGGSDTVRSGFGARFAGIYREAIDLLIEMGNTAEAFNVLERYRARELLALLSARDLVFSSDIPQELEHRRRSADRGYDRAFGHWLELSQEAGEEERRAAREELEQMRRRQDEIRTEIRMASPRLAALQDPQPLDLSATRAALDPGTLLLSYSIGKEKSYLFTVGSPSEELQVFPLSVGEDTLREEVQRFRKALARGRIDRRPEKVLLSAARLSDQLLAPAAARIVRAERLLILADGPLHSMPFAALADPGAIEERRFLIDAKPVHLAASATVFALLKQERREQRTTKLTAFGDPRYPAMAPRDGEPAPHLTAALRSGFDLAPLPATRGEVEELSRLYPLSSRTYLGAEATEARAKAVDHETTHLHIASHGLLDDLFPLDSALAFSIPPRWQEGEDNGLLQAWEIFEQVRIDADLVTLSACDTGRGKVLGGEGMMGLTRAFQYAGARTVVASLWSVSDESTGELMKRFYGYLKEGQSKADALRSAQLDLRRDSAFSHPFHWAGFQMVGDWR